MKTKILLYARSLISLIHIAFIKIFNFRHFYSGWAQDISASTKIFMRDGGKIFLDKHIHTKKDVEISAAGGTISIGEGCFFNKGCMAVSMDSVTIGKKSSFGPNVLIYDHDHDTRRSEETESAYKTAPVFIGNRVWIGANTVILRGSVIGDNCVIGAGSVIKGEYPPNSVIIQKRSEEIIQEGKGAPNGAKEEYTGL